MRLQWILTNENHKLSKNLQNQFIFLEQIDKLQKENIDLKTKIDNLILSNEKLTSKIDELKVSNDELKTEIQNLKSNNNDLLPQ